jgi:hypothetical protein
MVDLLLTREDIQVKFGGPKSHSPIALAVAGGHYGVMFRLLCFAYKAKYSDNLK